MSDRIPQNTRFILKNGLEFYVESKNVKNFLPESQYYSYLMKNISEKVLRVKEKAVLLHPLSEGTRGNERGEPESEVL